MERKLFRSCPDCSTKIEYSAKGDFNKAAKKTTLVVASVRISRRLNRAITTSATLYTKHKQRTCALNVKKKKTRFEAGTRNCPQCILS